MITNCVYSTNCNKKDCNKDFCLRQYKLDSLFNNSLLTDAQRVKQPLRPDADGTDYDKFVQLKNIADNIETFVNNGQNLYIYSVICGNGKTSWAIRLIQEYFNCIWPKADTECHALFINVPKYIIAMKDRINSADPYFDYIKQNILAADLVVWDDIATKVATQYELDRLLPDIDSRIAQNKANIYTSNLRPDEIARALDARLASRVCQKSTQIELSGGDKRGLTVSGGILNGKSMSNN